MVDPVERLPSRTTGSRPEANGATASVELMIRASRGSLSSYGASRGSRVHSLLSVNTGQWLAHFNGCLREPRARALRLNGLPLRLN